MTGEVALQKIEFLEAVVSQSVGQVAQAARQRLDPYLLLLAVHRRHLLSDRLRSGEQRMN